MGKKRFLFLIEKGFSLKFCEVFRGMIQMLFLYRYRKKTINTSFSLLKTHYRIFFVYGQKNRFFIQKIC